MFRVIKIHQLTKNAGLTFGQLFPGPRMASKKRGIGYLFKYTTQLLPIACSYVEHKKQELTKKNKELTLNQLTPKLPKRDFSLPHKVHGPNFAR